MMRFFHRTARGSAVQDPAGASRDISWRGRRIRGRSAGRSRLASFLRTRQLGARLAGPSLPLDVGHSAEIPAAIRRAVILRDQHCRWAGGYFP
jgi:hypothetical protein